MALALIALFCGLLFGLGLLWSGMGNPAKVQDFLDLFGHWDLSLAFVMLGAIAVASLAFAWARHRQRSLLGQALQVPTSQRIDARLLGGAALFGVGWGLAGFCPAPALMNLATGQSEVVLFVAAMVAGMGLHGWLGSRASDQA